VWDIERGYCTHNFKEHTEIVQSVVFHPDPLRLTLFSCSEDCTIRVHNLQGTGKKHWNKKAIHFYCSQCNND